MREQTIFYNCSLICNLFLVTHICSNTPSNVQESKLKGNMHMIFCTLFDMNISITGVHCNSRCRKVPLDNNNTSTFHAHASCTTSTIMQHFIVILNIVSIIIEVTSIHRLSSVAVFLRKSLLMADQRLVICTSRLLRR